MRVCSRESEERMRIGAYFIFSDLARKILIPGGLAVSDSGAGGQILAYKGFMGKILRNKELAAKYDTCRAGLLLSELGGSGRIFHDFPLGLERE